MSDPRQVVLARELTQAPQAEDFELAGMEIPAIADGQLLVRVTHLSLDPYVGSVLRGRHISGPPPAIGGLIPGSGLGEVIESRATGFETGDYVVGETGWRTHAGVDPPTARKVDPALFPLSVHLGAGGMPGLTAFASMHHLAEVGQGDQVLISSAAGPVGGTAGQIARIQGAERVVGIAGSDEKCRLVVETYGFDACINYKTDDWQDQLAAAFPNGIDVYHDNVGGDLLMTALTNLANYGRVVLCGLASQYHLDDEERKAGPFPGIYIVKRAKLMGLVVYDFLEQMEGYATQVGQWIGDGKLRYAEDRADSIERTPDQFAKLMRGENVGKAIVALAPEGRE